MTMDIAVLTNMLAALVVDWGLSVIGAIAVLIVGRIVAGSARKLARAALARAGVDPTLISFAGGLIYAGLMILVGIAVLGMFGVPTGSFVAVLGAAGLAIGLAFQGTFSNFASGVMLLLFRPISSGDFVEIGGTTGTVDEVGIFSTVVNTPDNVRVIVPNSNIFGQTIANFSANGTRRIDLVIGVGYDDDLALVVRMIEDVIGAHPGVLPVPEPVVAVSELADSSVNLVVRPWCTAADYSRVRWDLTRAIKERLEEAGCTIPYPQRDVHVHQPLQAL
jgi:small conductance mechanosensitive channel